MLLVVPVLMTVVSGCKSIDELTNELKSSGQPVVSSIVPDNAKVGATVTVRGINFEVTQGRIGFQDANNNVAVGEIQGWADDFIAVKVPALAGNPTTSQVHIVTASGKILAINPTLTINP